MDDTPPALLSVVTYCHRRSTCFRFILDSSFCQPNAELWAQKSKSWICIMGQVFSKKNLLMWITIYCELVTHLLCAREANIGSASWDVYFWVFPRRYFMNNDLHRTYCEKSDTKDLTSAFIFITVFWTIFNWHNLVEPSADCEANLSRHQLSVPPNCFNGRSWKNTVLNTNAL